MKNFLLLTSVFIFIIYTILSFVFAFNGYPGYTNDSVCFLPTAYFINHYHQLINPLYDAGLDPVHHRFLFYPPLFPYVVAFINNMMPEFFNNSQVTLTIIDFFSLIVLFLTVFVYVRQSQVKPSIAFYLFTIVWLLGLFSFYGIADGRPEILSHLFIACFLLNNVYNNNKYRELTNGLLIGLCLITSPISSFYLILITLGLFVYNKEFKLKPIVSSIFGFSIVLVCFIVLYPYHIIELITSLRKHSQNVIINRHEFSYWSDFIKYYVTNVYCPLLAFNSIIVICYVYYKLFKTKEILCICLLVVLTLMISFFSFRNMGLFYNMLVLAPIIFFILFIFCTKAIERKGNKLFSKVALTTVILLLLINSIGNIRKTLLFFITNDSKVSYADFRKDFVNVCNMTDKKKKIVIMFPLWPYCLDKYKNIKVWTTKIQPDTSDQYIVVSQLYSGFSEPEAKAGYTVIRNGFIKKHPTVGPLKLGNTVPWFQTAVYKRN